MLLLFFHFAQNALFFSNFLYRKKPKKSKFKLKHKLLHFHNQKKIKPQSRSLSQTFLGLILIINASDKEGGEYSCLLTYYYVRYS